MPNEVETVVEALKQESTARPELGTGVFLQVHFTDPITAKQACTYVLPRKFRKNSDTTVCFVVKDPAQIVETAVKTDPLTATLFDDIIGVGKLRRRVAHGRKNKTTTATMKFAKAFTFICVQHSAEKPLEETLGPGFYKRTSTWPIAMPYAPGKGEQMVKFVKLLKQTTQFALKPGSQASAAEIGDTRMDLEKLVENVKSAIEQCRTNLPGGRTASYTLKTNHSAAIPI